MIYFITEDTGSGYDFYRIINKAIMGNKSRLLTGRGIGNVPRLLRELTIKKGDTIILAIDYIDIGFTQAVFTTLQKMRREVDFKVLITEAYCYEEIILSSSEIKEIEVLDFISKSINKLNEDYSDLERKSELLEDIIRNKKLVNRGHSFREKLSFFVLEEISSGTPFKTTKGSLSECFKENCCYRDRYGNYYEDGKIKCLIYTEIKRYKVKDKIERLLRRSLIEKTIGVDKLMDISNDEVYQDTDYKSLLYSEYGLNYGKISEIHDKTCNIEHYGADIFERVYKHESEKKYAK